MAHFKNLQTNGQKGKVTYNNGIVTGIITLAVSEIEGVELLTNKKKGIKLFFEKDGIYVDISLKVRYGYNVPDVAFKTQQAIKHNVESMSEFKVSKVNVHVFSVVNGDEIK